MRAIASIELNGHAKVASGKVREIFDLGEHYLFVATDRISAYDVVMPTAIPRKGEVLTQLSRFWFAFLGEGIANHLVSADPDDLPASLAAHRDQLADRFMIVKKLEMVPVECVVRGYLAGSGWAEYRRDRTICGIPLPNGLDNAEKLPEPIFTPAAKATSGHDENITFSDMADRVGEDLAGRLRDLSLEIYGRAAAHAAARGVLIADTKFEFGLDGDRIVLADEVLTPDSSRYWPEDGYATGANPPSFDKQYVRDYLSTLEWDKTPPGPSLPDTIVAGTTERYLEAYRRITDRAL